VNYQQIAKDKLKQLLIFFDANNEDSDLPVCEHKFFPINTRMGLSTQRPIVDQSSNVHCRRFFNHPDSSASKARFESVSAGLSSSSRILIAGP